MFHFYDIFSMQNYKISMKYGYLFFLFWYKKTKKAPKEPKQGCGSDSV